MRVSSAIVRQQSQMVAALGASAAAAIAAGIRETGEAEAVPAVARQVAQAYTTMSAAVTAQYYNRIRQASGVRSRFSAEALSGYDAGKVTAAAISILEEVADGRATVALDKLLGDLMQREVKNAADNCIRGNCAKDPAKPRYAIVPNGDACAFCQMRASLGYTYADEDAVESHDHCSCTPTPVFGDSTIQDYDPKMYEDRWNKAAEALEKGDISKDLKQRIADQKEAKGKDFDRTNAILMVMREQQGIK